MNRPLFALRFCRGVLFVLVCSAFAPSQLLAQNLPMAKPESVGMSSERLGRIRVAMQRYVDRNEVAGVVTLVARKGRVVHLEAVGYRDAEGKSPTTPDTIFRIASMTKPIASVALMMLFEEGHFLLSDPVSKWLPEFADMKVVQPAPPGERVETPFSTVPAKRPITIKHVLTHTAGLPNSYRGWTQPEYAKLAGRHKPGDTMADTITRLSKLPLNFQPGEAWEYGPATDVVGRLVEVISGQPLDEYFRKRIFEPLGMHDTYFYMPASKVDRLAALYRPGPDKKIQLAEAPIVESRWIKEPHVYFSGAGGLVSTAPDYFRFHQLMLNGGELNGVHLLGRKTVELMTTNHIGDLPIWLTGPGYGFGLGYSVVKDIGATGLPASVGSYGWGGAFCTYFWVDPKEEMIGIVMAQVRPYTHLNIRQEFQVLACQAIVDSPQHSDHPKPSAADHTKTAGPIATDRSTKTTAPPSK
jgi:CubicO group peptidase (beta-lactamase class C family)